MLPRGNACLKSRASTAFPGIYLNVSSRRELLTLHDTFLVVDPIVCESAKARTADDSHIFYVQRADEVLSIDAYRNRTINLLVG